MARINTFLIGAQKAGTTSLYDWLSQHPQVSAPGELKDYHFFSKDSFFNQGPDAIDKYYKSRSSIRLHGAVNYLYFDNIVAERIFSYNPEAKIVICLREPVDRAVSAYKYFVRTQREFQSFGEAIRRELAAELTSYQELANQTYIGHGRYSDQISTYIEYFGRTRVHVLFYEEIIDGSLRGESMDGLCDFIGIDSFDFSFTRLNASTLPRSPALNKILRGVMKPAILKRLMPLTTRKKIGKTLEKLNSSDDRIDVPIDEVSVCLLRAELCGQSHELSRLLGVDVDMVNGWASSD
ncbi:sulfotransferase [Halioglobus sp.]|nr:sulfotransferase [Halioglobus sp.]